MREVERALLSVVCLVSVKAVKLAIEQVDELGILSVACLVEKKAGWKASCWERPLDDHLVVERVERTASSKVGERAVWKVALTASPMDDW